MSELRACPDCGYGHGFHVWFRDDEPPGAVRVGLICPSCGRSFDLGWTVQARSPAGARPGDRFDRKG